MLLVKLDVTLLNKIYKILLKKENIDFTIVNGENAVDDGVGITAKYFR